MKTLWLGEASQVAFISANFKEMWQMIPFVTCERYFLSMVSERMTRNLSGISLFNINKTYGSVLFS